MKSILNLSILFVIIVSNPATSSYQFQDCDEIHMIAEEQPKFNKGIQEFYSLVQQRIKMKDLINQSLNIEYVVTKNGMISNVKVTGMKEGAKNELIEYLENLKGWEAGKIKGEPVCVKMILPIRYRP